MAQGGGGGDSPIMAGAYSIIFMRNFSYGHKYYYIDR